MEKMKTDWINIEDRLPDKAMKVKWKCSDGIEDVGFYFLPEKEFGTWDLRSLNEITHWKPL